MAGSASAHEKATNFLMEANGRFDLLRSKPLNGDLQTRSAKRKGVATDAIGEEDSHCFDTVMMTSFRRSNIRRRILETDQFSHVDDILGPSDSTHIPSNNNVMPSTDAWSSDVFPGRTGSNIPTCQMSEDVFPAETGSHVLHPQPAADFVPPETGPDVWSGRRSPDVVELSDSECMEYIPEPAIGTSRRAPPTPESHVRVRPDLNRDAAPAPDENRGNVADGNLGSASNGRVRIGREVLVPLGAWYIGRISTRGVGPKCCASLGRNDTREECWNYIKKVSFPNPMGRVGIAIFTAHRLFGGIQSRVTWFCPNNICWRGKARYHSSLRPFQS